VLITRLPPKVIFLFSSVRRTIGAIAWMYSGQYQMTGSRNLDKMAADWCWPPCFWVSTPRPTPLFIFTKKWKGCSREGKAYIRAVKRLVLVHLLVLSPWWSEEVGLVSFGSIWDTKI
jgi:hypothetical protein